MSDQYRVLFRGDVVNGCSVKEVKSKLAKLLNEDDEKIDKLFSGETFVLKKSPDREKCEKIRRSFIAVGAVCYIKDPSTDSRLGKIGQIDSTLQVVEEPDSQENQPAFEKRKNYSFKEISDKATSISRQARQSFADSVQKTKKVWRKGSESIQSDMEIGGIRLLMQNRFFLGVSAASLVILCLLAFGLAYERKSMPLTAGNLDTLVDHIEFIENAFTTEELENMTRNRSDFLDYLLVDPIKKMGYQFEPTLREIVDEYLDEDLEPDKMMKAKIYLAIASHEREELLRHGVISTDMKKQLDAVARSMGK